jgi:mannose-1-phosphate guanylyltransferase
MKLIVTAGGQGTKLWPYSRENTPKQFQAIVGDKPMVQYTVDLLLTRFDPKDIFISTKKKYAELSYAQAPKIPKENFILEPDYAKNRGPGEGYAFFLLSLKFPDEPCMIIQPDVLRDPETKFLDMIELAEQLVKRDKKFISAGAKALYPTMGIDYLKLGERIRSDSAMEIYKVAEFVERNNDYEQTKKLISNYRVTTHSNHMCWYPELIMDAYKKYKPDWWQAFMEMKKVMDKPNHEQLIDEIYKNMEAGPTEVVTQHLFPEGYIIMHPFVWTDIGTWETVYNYLKKDDNGNVVDGNAILKETENVLVKSTKKKLIATIGVDNLVIIETDDAILVARRDKSDQVKKILEELEKRKLKEYL